MAALQARSQQGAGGLSHLVSQALSQFLETPLHTLFQVSTSGSLVAGLYAGAVTCAKILEHGDFGLVPSRISMARWSCSTAMYIACREAGPLPEASPSDEAPFAIVTRFTPAVSAQLGAAAGYDAFKAQLDSYGVPTTCSMRSASTAPSNTCGHAR